MKQIQKCCHMYILESQQLLFLSLTHKPAPTKRKDIVHVCTCLCAHASLNPCKNKKNNKKPQQNKQKPAKSSSLQTLSGASVSHVTLYFLPITHKTCGTDATDEFPPPPLPLSPAGKLHDVSGRCVSSTKNLLASDQGGGPLTGQRHH